jgi:hypothetical protein
MSNTRLRRPAFVRWLIWTTTACCLSAAGHSAALSDGPSRPGDEIAVYHLTPDERGGKAYKLVYLVRVPLDVYWNFKTDFDNDFLLDNKYIREHRFVSRAGGTVITEDKYTNTPDVFFKWQTTVDPEARRLDFVLMNPQHCSQLFHYGSITMEATAEGTLVTQVAYFDFLGASLWAGYPWGGGMTDFLTYTARWEQGIVLRLKNRYSGKSAQ